MQQITHSRLSQSYNDKRQEQSMNRIIAMWSGPRNISTAMMRSWENRSDCTVWDEPLYAHYLLETGIAHPMATDIIAAYESDLQTLIDQIVTQPDTGIFYQKHISTHILDHMPLDWLSQVNNVFLIRDPRHMVASYSQKRGEPNAADFGYPQLETVFNAANELSDQTPMVIDSKHFLENPEAHLRYMCEQLNMPFEQQMLKWPAGERTSDGIWHTHWYDSVKKSTHFGAPRQELPVLNDLQQSIVDECMPHYTTLSEAALQFN
jgi:hypothetical protein